MKKNIKLTLFAGLTIISLLAMSFSTLNLEVKAQSQNQTSPQVSQEVEKRLAAVSQKFRELVSKSGANLTLPQSGNLTDQVRKLSQSSGIKTLSQQLPQLSDLGINTSNIKQLQTGSNDLPGLVKKFGILADLIP
jgi:phage terminase large subunit-like protein